LLQEFRPKLANRGGFVNLNVAKKAEALAYRTGGAEFAGGQSHKKLRYAR
jgi:hypothetical protein